MHALWKKKYLSQLIGMSFSPTSLQAIDPKGSLRLSNAAALQELSGKATAKALSFDHVSRISHLASVSDNVPPRA